MNTSDEPMQPSLTDWDFINELSQPLKRRFKWIRNSINTNEADLSNGISIRAEFSDPEDHLESAYRDLDSFFADSGLETNGEYEIIIEQIETECFEAYRIDIGLTSCRIQAADTEGIRRGIVYLEDEILRSDGPFLPVGVTERWPVIKTRISRCFFGPIKRPPINRDELTDGVDYYPDEYLNRLVHEGINALWLSVSFKDLCPSDIYPTHGHDSERRFAKLRQTVDKCARYGIKIFVFFIEPWSFGSSSDYQSPMSTLDDHPDLAGNHSLFGINFCTATEKGQRYLEECTYHIFSNVPKLGGLINISLGERPTHCYSWVTFSDNSCPRCSQHPPWKAVNITNRAITDGMKRASPDAQMISWLYVGMFEDNAGESIEETSAVLAEIAAHTPTDITLQYNFESMGTTLQLGKERVVLDYFLSWPGPSEIFKTCATNAINNGATVSAKIQVGCSHELATVPFVPVPGNLYQKYQAMHELGVSSVMQCWYFGNYPGVMNKAAGELSFAPFPETQDEFLFKLAQTDWGIHAAKVVEIWNYFQESYANFPVNLGFTHYGPLHHSIVWPIHLFPADKPISPSWKFTFPLESGDRIGECLCYDHTLAEAIILLNTMADLWGKGTELFKIMKSDFRNDRERLLDIRLAEAINLQINSAKNIFTFYALREELAYLSQDDQLASVLAMRKIVNDEINSCEAMKELCQFDSRLGFHSEAEGYKYDSDKLTKRSVQLKNILQNDFPKLEVQIMGNEMIFPEYTGKRPQGKCYTAKTNKCSIDPDIKWETIGGTDAIWSASCDGTNLYFYIKGEFSEDDTATVEIEPCRLWPTQKFSVSRKNGQKHLNFKIRMDHSWQAEATNDLFRFKIPLNIFDGYYIPGRPIRINICLNDQSWIQKHPWTWRLRFLTDNSDDLGWLYYIL